MEAFSSQGDGTLTIIKENSPTSFEVEQTVQTKPRAKTCTLDTKNNQIILITTERPPGSPSAEGAASTSAPPEPCHRPLHRHQSRKPPRRLLRPARIKPAAAVAADAVAAAVLPTLTFSS